MDRPATDAIQLPPPFFCALGGKGREWGAPITASLLRAPRLLGNSLCLFINCRDRNGVGHARVLLKQLLAQPRASASAKRIISSGGRACGAQPSGRGKFFVLQLDTALEALA
jgi:hypothetical protein